MPNTWLDYFTGSISLEDAQDFKELISLSDSAKSPRCWQLARAARNTAFLIKSKDFQDPLIVHTFGEAEGSRNDLGFRNKLEFVLTGFETPASHSVLGGQLGIGRQRK